MGKRLDLLETAQSAMRPNAPFIQFTYAVVAPMPARSTKLYRHRLEPGLAQPAAGTRVGVPPSGMTDVLDPRSRLIVALDVASVSEARTLVERIGDAGVQDRLSARLCRRACLAGELVQAGRQVFLDLKLHDIGNTVEEGVRSVARTGASLLTVHAYPQTMRAAARESLART